MPRGIYERTDVMRENMSKAHIGKMVGKDNYIQMKE